MALPLAATTVRFFFRVVTPIIAVILVPAIRCADLAEAERLVRSGKLEEARAVFEVVLKTEPKYAAALAGLGWIAMRQGRLDDSVKLLERAVALDAANCRYSMWLGTSYGVQASRASLLSKPGLASKCRRALEKAVELDPKDFEAAISLSNFYLLAPGFLGGGAEKALKLARDFTAYDPLRGALFEAQVQEHEKKWTEAGAAVRRAIAIQPDHLDANLRLGMVLVSAGEYEPAFAHFKKFAADRPEHVAICQFHIGRAASISGLHAEEGIEALRAFIAASEGKRGPSPADGYFRLGTIEEKRGRAADARAAYEMALKLDPKNRGAADALKKLK